MTNEASLAEFIEKEPVLQRWTGEGGSPQGPFGRLDKLQAQLERYREACNRVGDVQYADPCRRDRQPGFEDTRDRPVSSSVAVFR